MKTPSSTPSLTPPASDRSNGSLANWKTYKNEGLGFSIEYPPGLESIFSDPNSITIGSPPEFLYISVIKSQFEERAYNYFPDEYQKMIKLEIGEKVNSRFFQGRRVEDSKIGNLTAKQFIDENSDEFPENITERRLLVAKDNLIYMIGGYLNSSMSNELFSQILSTLRFLD